MSYDPPPLPKVGDRIHRRNGPRSQPGEVLAIVDRDDAGFFVFAARFWWRRRRRRYTWECFTSIEWECGIVRPGPVPEGER